MFIGREKELNLLHERYESNKFQCIVIYGRRRVGKTALINEFIKDKDVVMYTGLEMDAQRNLEELSKAVFKNDIYPTGTLLQGYQTVLEIVLEMAQKKKVIFAIDEYPYLAKAFPGISSLLQVQIDHKFQNTNLFLILCGSSMSFMENQVLGYHSPLYGRRTAQIKLFPFDFFETKKFFTKFTPEETAIIYGITGGTPQYLNQIDEELSLEQNIKKHFMNPLSYLFEEPTNLLKQEVREPATYNSIISVIANGSSKFSEISSKVECSLTEYLNNLISLGLIKKETPAFKSSPQKTIYKVADGLFRFWYRFISKNVSQLQQGNIDVVYRKISAQLPSFMGSVFEEICKQYMWKLLLENKLPIEFDDIGRWWGNDPRNRCEAEIDLLAYEGKESAIFCECKWTNEKVDNDILNVLIDRSGLFHFPNKYYYLFSKSGFTERFIQKADTMSNVKLIAFDEMVE